MKETLNVKVDSPFLAIVNEMNDTYIKKNRDYGNSFSDLFNKYGPIVSVIHMNEKLNRFANLFYRDPAVVNESVRDTLLDLANYAILTVIEYDKKTGNHIIKETNINYVDNASTDYNTFATSATPKKTNHVDD